MKICKHCKKDFEPNYKNHEYCPNCWDKIYRERHPEEFRNHRICQAPGCKKIIDDQPEGFRYCVSCWVKMKNKSPS